MKMVFDKIENASRVYSSEDLEFLRSYSAQAYKVNRLYWVFVVVAVAWHSAVSFTVHLINVLTPGNETLLTERPRNIKYFIGILDESPFFSITHGFIGDMFGFMCVAGFDTLYYHAIYHTCAIFAVVELVETLESAFSPLYLFNTGYAILSLIIFGVKVVLYKGAIFKRLHFMYLALSQIVHLFCYNWPGQNIENHSLSIDQACYDCGWYEQSVPDDLKKSLKLIMLRSQRPCQLSAGKIFILGFQYFTTVMKLSMSYFTVVSAFYDEVEFNGDTSV